MKVHSLFRIGYLYLVLATYKSLLFAGFPAVGFTQSILTLTSSTGATKPVYLYCFRDFLCRLAKPDSIWQLRLAGAAGGVPGDHGLYFFLFSSFSFWPAVADRAMRHRAVSFFIFHLIFGFCSAVPVLQQSVPSVVLRFIYCYPSFPFANYLFVSWVGGFRLAPSTWPCVKAQISIFPYSHFRLLFFEVPFTISVLLSGNLLQMRGPIQSCISLEKNRHGIFRNTHIIYIYMQICRTSTYI